MACRSRDIFGVVVPRTHIEKRPLGDLVACVSVVDVFLAADDVADAVTGVVVGLNAVAVGQHILHDHGLLDRCCF